MTKQGQSLDKQIKAENKEVEKWLLWYAERKKDIEGRRQDILLSVPIGPAVVPDTEGNISDNTGRRAMQLAKLHQDEAWLAVVEEVERKLPWKMQTVLRLRREARYKTGYCGRGRPAWIAYVQRRYCQERAAREGKRIMDVWVDSPGTFTKWWHRIVDYTAREAAKKGLWGNGNIE